MAEVKGVEFTGSQRAWIKLGLEAKRDQLVRVRNKEVAGSEIWVLRGKEIEALSALILMF